MPRPGTIISFVSIPILLVAVVLFTAGYFTGTSQCPECEECPQVNTQSADTPPTDPVKEDVLTRRMLMRLGGATLVHPDDGKGFLLSTNGLVDPTYSIHVPFDEPILIDGDSLLIKHPCRNQQYLVDRISQRFRQSKYETVTLALLPCDG